MKSYVVDLSDETYGSLKERASGHGVSIEEEIDAVFATWFLKYQSSQRPLEARNGLR